MIRTVPSTLFVGVCSLSGVRRHRSLALAQERRVIQRALGSLDLGAGLVVDAAAEQEPSPPLSTHMAGRLGHEACSSLLAFSAALSRADVTLAVAPAVEPLSLLRAETQTYQTVESDAIDPTWETSAVVEIGGNDGPSRAILVQCAALVDGVSFLAVADRAEVVVAHAAVAACARPPDGASPICEYVNAFESAPLSEPAPRDGGSVTAAGNDATCLATLGPDDTLPLDFGDVVINSLRDD